MFLLERAYGPYSAIFFSINFTTSGFSKAESEYNLKGLFLSSLMGLVILVPVPIILLRYPFGQTLL